MKDMIKIQFDGYWLERYQSEIPQETGIYCVYACEPIAKDRIVVLREILYIGETDNAKQSIVEHKDTSAWKTRLQEKEELCYSFAKIETKIRNRVLSAIVSHHRPPYNRIIEHQDCDVRLTITGEHELLDDLITFNEK